MFGICAMDIYIYVSLNDRYEPHSREIMCLVASVHASVSRFVCLFVQQKHHDTWNTVKFRVRVLGNKTFLSPPVLMHGGLLCVAFRLSVCPSVCLSLYQKSLDNNSLEKKLLEKNSYL